MNIYTLHDIIKRLFKKKSFLLQYVDKLDKIKSPSFKNVYKSNFSIYSITPLISNIIDYTKMLESVINHIYNKEMINNRHLHYNDNDVNVDLRDFMIYNDTYIDCVSEFDKFKSLSIKLLLIYEEFNNRHNLSSVEERNKYLLKDIASNITVLIDQLRAIKY